MNKLQLVCWCLLATFVFSSCGFKDESGSSEPDDTSCNCSLTMCVYPGDTSPGPSPLVAYQWYLYNNGDDKSKAFVQDNTGTNHANVLEAHRIATGKGIRVNVIDSGLQLNHEDLSTDQCRSYDYKEKDNNPQPLANGGDHGTSVAGIIGMKNNSVGGVGVAPGATLIGHGLIGRAGYTFAEYANALGVEFTPSASVTNLADVYNMSYSRGADITIGGGSTLSITSFENEFYTLVFKTGRRGRNSKGYIYVKAAGNNYKKTTYEEGGKIKETPCNLGETSCESTSFDPHHVSAEIIVVAATNSLGKLTSYSTTGSAIWVAAPGGQFAIDTDYIVLRDESYRNVIGPAMVTADVMSCSKGYSQKVIFTSQTFTLNLFEYTPTGPNSLNKNCNYTSTFNGTSAAAPLVSGVTALMLEANPNLSWREVKYILAKTATKIDPSDADKDIRGVKIKNGWTDNKARINFSTFYGFGQVDADEAVKMAKVYSTDWGDYLEKDYTNDVNLPISIPDDSTTGVSHRIEVDESVKFIENVRLTLSISSMYPADYTIHLTSPEPAGTTSVLKWTNDSFTKGSIKDFAILSNAFLGEDPDGTWTVKLFDLTSDAGNPSADGKLTAASLKVSGH